MTCCSIPIGENFEELTHCNTKKASLTTFQIIFYNTRVITSKSNHIFLQHQKSLAETYQSSSYNMKKCKRISTKNHMYTLVYRLNTEQFKSKQVRKHDKSDLPTMTSHMNTVMTTLWSEIKAELSRGTTNQYTSMCQSLALCSSHSPCQ